MSSAKRIERVSHELHVVLADALRREIKDPRVTPISLTGVRLSGDLGVAWVHYAPLGGDGDLEAIAAGLKAASGFLRREVGRRMRLRHTPELVFLLDDGIDEAIRMTRLLSRMEEQEAVGANAVADAPEGEE